MFVLDERPWKTYLWTCLLLVMRDRVKVDEVKVVCLGFEFRDLGVCNHIVRI